MSDLYETIFEITRQVPKGKVTTYGAIARAIGSAKSARMVGWALNSKKNQLGDIPAHRVVNRFGHLTGSKFFPFETMREMLLNEGVEIIDNRIVNFETYFWDPSQIIKINIK